MLSFLGVLAAKEDHEPCSQVSTRTSSHHHAAMCMHSTVTACPVHVASAGLPSELLQRLLLAPQARFDSWHQEGLTPDNYKSMHAMSSRCHQHSSATHQKQVWRVQAQMGKAGIVEHSKYMSQN